ncbi:MAG: hypothetical protein IKB70_12415, partial [Bacilli bacterium]|nr:hypothetical protein [Bacilli bacterium]
MLIEEKPKPLKKFGASFFVFLGMVRFNKTFIEKTEPQNYLRLRFIFVYTLSFTVLPVGLRYGKNLLPYGRHALNVMPIISRCVRRSFTVVIPR